MRRREFLGILGSAAAMPAGWPRAAHAQQAGTLKKPIAFERYVDERFVRAARAAQILV